MENPTLEIDSSSEHELEPASNFDKTMDFFRILKTKMMKSLNL